MRNSKSRGYINYGSTPRNEYTTASTKNNTDSIDVLEHDAQADDTMSRKRLRKLHAQYPPISGWKCSGKVNGWRAELASRHDESTEARRYFNYGEKKSTHLNKRTPVNNQKKDVQNKAMTMSHFIMEEINLICIYKANTCRETLSNMQAARIYIDDSDMLVILDSAADKLDNMTDAAFSEIAFDSNLCVLL